MKAAGLNAKHLLSQGWYSSPSPTAVSGLLLWLTLERSRWHLGLCNPCVRSEGAVHSHCWLWGSKPSDGTSLPHSVNQHKLSIMCYFMYSRIHNLIKTNTICVFSPHYRNLALETWHQWENKKDVSEGIDIICASPFHPFGLLSKIPAFTILTECCQSYMDCQKRFCYKSIIQMIMFNTQGIFTLELPAVIVAECK